MGQRQLRNGVGGGTRGILHGDAVCLGIGHVDVVDADAAADDELQAGALRSIDVIGAHLGGRADDHDVKVADGLAQLLGRVELFAKIRIIFEYSMRYNFFFFFNVFISTSCFAFYNT